MGRRHLHTTTDGWTTIIPACFLKMMHYSPYVRNNKHHVHATLVATGKQRTYYKNPRTRPFPSSSQHCPPSSLSTMASSQKQPNHTLKPSIHRVSRSTSHESGGSHSRTSFPYPLPHYLQGRLQPPPNIPTYLRHHLMLGRTRTHASRPTNKRNSTSRSYCLLHNKQNSPYLQHRCPVDTEQRLTRHSSCYYCHGYPSHQNQFIHTGRGAALHASPTVT
jgi:hypothetical protein